MRNNAEILKDIQDAEHPAPSVMLELWERNAGIIRRCAAAWRDCGISQDDLRQEAYFAMLAAVRRYRKTGGRYAFTTILTKSIRWRYSRLVSNSRYLHEERLALNAPMGEEEDGSDMTEIIAADQEAEAHTVSNLYREEMRKAFAEALRRLDDDARRAFLYRLVYGQTVARAAEIMNTTAERVKRLYDGAMRQMRSDRRLMLQLFG